MNKTSKIKNYWNNNIHSNYIESGIRYMSIPFLRFGNMLEFKRIASLATLSKDTTVLELGCGSGRLTVLLAPLVKKITAVDNANKQLTQLKSELYKSNIINVDVVLQDALDFDSAEKYDVVFLGWFTQYLTDKELGLLLSRISGYLSTNGCVISKDTFSLLNPIDYESEDYFSKYRTLESLTSIYNANHFSGIKAIHPYFNVYDLVFLRLKIKPFSNALLSLMRLLEPLFLKFYLVFLYVFKLLNKDGPSYYQAIVLWRYKRSIYATDLDIMALARPFSFLDHWNYTIGAKVLSKVQGLKITANTITLMSFIIALFGCGSVLLARIPVLFSIAMIVSFTLDNMDGLWARLKHQQSEFGGFFDEFSDTVKEYVIDLALFFFFIEDLLKVFPHFYALLGAFFAYISIKSIFYIYHDKKLARAAFSNYIKMITYSPAERYLLWLPLVPFYFYLYLAYYCIICIAYTVAVGRIFVNKYEHSRSE